MLKVLILFLVFAARVERRPAQGVDGEGPFQPRFPRSRTGLDRS